MLTEVAGITLNYERAGSGKPVLILHGWGASTAATKPMADCVVKLGFEAVSLDFPGFGGSPEPKAAWGVREYADITRGFIMQQGIYGCDVICHSFGGRIVIMLASEDGALFNRLILVDAAGIRPKRGAAYYIRVWSYKLGKRLAKVELIDRMFKLSQKQRSAGSADYRNASDIMRATLVKAVNLDLTDRLSNIENETLLIWGENDTATPLYMAELMKKRIKNAGLAVIPNAGHFSYAEDYPRFCSILKIILTQE